MKKVITFMIIAFIAFSSTVYAVDTAPSETETVYVPEAKMNIDLPSGWILITQNMDNNDPMFTELGMDYPAIQQYMIQNKTFLNAIDVENGCEILINVVETEDSIKAVDYRLMPESAEKQLLGAKDAVKNKLNDTLPETVTLNNAGFTEVATTDQGKFFYLDRSINVSDELVSNTYGAITIADKKTIGINLFVYNQDISEEQKAQVQEIVKSIQFDQSVHDAYQIALNKPQEKYSTYQRICSLLVLAMILYIVIMLIIRHKRKKNHQSIESIKSQL